VASVELHGQCDSRFEPLRAAFAENFSARAEVGASLCVVEHGAVVVDLWGGSASADGSQPWQRGTIANVYSTTKGVAAVAAAMLADRGALDVERPVAAYWPQFAQAGKERINVRQLLTHEAGLAGLDAELPDGAVLDWDYMIGALERQAPLWRPGAGLGYHAITYGWLVGEVIRRVDGRSCGEFVRAEIAAPLGVDFYIGLPEAEDARTAELIAAPASPSGGRLIPRLPGAAISYAGRASAASGRPM